MVRGALATDRCARGRARSRAGRGGGRAGRAPSAAGGAVQVGRRGGRLGPAGVSYSEETASTVPSLPRRRTASGSSPADRPGWRRGQRRRVGGGVVGWDAVWGHGGWWRGSADGSPDPPGPPAAVGAVSRSMAMPAPSTPHPMTRSPHRPITLPRHHVRSSAGVPRTTASLIRATRAIARTSWTRRCRHAGDGERRWQPYLPAGPPAATQDLADRRLSGGAGEDRPGRGHANSPSRRSSSRFCRHSLPKPKPGRRSACPRRCRPPVQHRVGVIARGARSSAGPPGRPRHVVHDDPPHPRPRHDGGQVRVAPRPRTSLTRSAPAASAASATAALLVSTEIGSATRGRTAASAGSSRASSSAPRPAGGLVGCSRRRGRAGPPRPPRHVRPSPRPPPALARPARRR
jgi:hypothetical protein